MGKVKIKFFSLSLRKSLIIYVITFALLAVFLSASTFAICNSISKGIREAYPLIGDKYYLTNEDGEHLGEGVYIGREHSPMSEQDKRKIAILEIVPIILVPIYSAFCIIAAALLFYKNKLKRPFLELGLASEKIANNDLDFSINYSSQDELGELCSSFERMRRMLADNFRKIWRQVEERKKINATFAHELRTPLTVLKGYTEMLRESNDTKTSDIAMTMSKHIVRMEAYVSSMSKLRRLEDLEAECKLICLKEFCSSLIDGAKIICKKNNIELILQDDLPNSNLILDSYFVSQVFNNLISNAIRYAKSKIKISFILRDKGLVMCIEDDGPGFAKNSLQKGVEAYYTEEDKQSDNLGLGLYIAKLLCELHGGYLKLENIETGARVLAYFASADL